jgi:hypothetical protein
MFYVYPAEQISVPQKALSAVLILDDGIIPALFITSVSPTYLQFLTPSSTHLFTFTL